MLAKANATVFEGTQDGEPGQERTRELDQLDSNDSFGGVGVGRFCKSPNDEKQLRVSVFIPRAALENVLCVKTQGDVFLFW